MLWKKNMNGVFNSTLLHNNNVKIHLACQDDLYQKRKEELKIPIFSRITIVFDCVQAKATYLWYELLLFCGLLEILHLTQFPLHRFQPPLDIVLLILYHIHGFKSMEILDPKENSVSYYISILSASLSYYLFGFENHILTQAIAKHFKKQFSHIFCKICFCFNFP